MQTLASPERSALLFCAALLWSAAIFVAASRAAAHIAADAAGMPPAAWAAALLLASVAACRASAADCVAACVCIALVAGAIVDARTGYLSDAVTLPAALLAAVAAIASVRSSHACGGVLLGAGTLGCMHLVTRGRAIGLGDVKALYSVGAAFGAADTAGVLAFASLSGLLVAALQGELRGGAERRFGPYLAAGAAFIFFARGI